MIPLHMLPNGSTARIAELFGDAQEVHRLEELGLKRGMLVEVVAAGSPCILRIDGCRICFRCNDLMGVLVTQEEAA